MTGLNCEIGWKTRLCQVGDELGQFHIWEQWSNVVDASHLRGGHPGGQIGQVYGIVEFKDGVRRVDPVRWQGMWRITMEELLKQVNEYLESKIPDTPKSTRNEIAAFLVHRFIIHEVDAIEKVNREWKKTLFGQKVSSLRRENAHASVYPQNWKGKDE